FFAGLTIAGAQDDTLLTNTPAPTVVAPTGVDPWEQLRQAAQQGDTSSILTTLEKNPNFDLEDANKEGETALILACKNGHWDTAKLLIEKGASINACTKIGWTPFLYCALAQQEELVIDLMNKGAEIEGRSNLCSSKDCPDIQTVPIALLQGNISNTPLMWCAMPGKERMLALLLERGADVAAEGPDGMTPLALAHACNHAQMVEVLIDHGASISMASGTPLKCLISLRDAIGSGHTLSDFVTLICILSIIAVCLFLTLVYYMIHSFHQKWDE
ncbi:MAG: ankyrin repeat domain-containing protein, partial [Akkermansia sp.]